MKKFHIALVGLWFVCIGAVGQTTFTYQGIKYGIDSKGDLHSLPAGIYIVNGKKIVVK